MLLQSVLICCLFAFVSSYDFGYDNLPKAFVDVNGDGHRDFCRFVGVDPNVFLSCHLSNSADEHSFTSVRGVDKGYNHLNRWFADANNDQRVDYCRFVGNSPFIRKSCLLAGPGGFNGEYIPQDQ